jgi:replicative DNA helicase
MNLKPHDSPRTDKEERPLPHNFEAEEQLLGALILNPEKIERAMDLVDPEDFYLIRNGQVYQLLIGLHKSQKHIDESALIEELVQRGQLERTGGEGYILRLVDRGSDSVRLEPCARLISELSLRRRLILAATEISSLAYNNDSRIREIEEVVQGMTAAMSLAESIDRANSIEAEEAVLGSLLIAPGAILKVASLLDPQDFYREKNGWIYDIIRDLYNRREPVDFLTVCNELEDRGLLEEVGAPSYLTTLVNSVSTASHAEHYARIVERMALRRRLISAAGQIAGIAYEGTEYIDEILERAEQIVFSVSQRRLCGDTFSIRQLLGEYFDQLERLYQHQEELRWVSTGFADLDRILGGLQPSDLIIVAGRPGMGKTNLVLSIAKHMAIEHSELGVPALFSLELAAEQLVQRLISSETGIDSQRLRQGKVCEDEINQVAQAIAYLSENAVFIDDTPFLSPLELRSKAHSLHAESPLGLIIVDYLQLMRVAGPVENRGEEVSIISRSLKALARELEVLVVATAQISAAIESRHDKRPILSDLQPWGTVEQNADVIMFMYRDDFYHREKSERPGVVEVNIAKNRHGGTGVVELLYDAGVCRFRDIESD